MNDTITAIATAYGVGSIAIIRLSGERALSIAEILTKRDGLKSDTPTWRLCTMPKRS